MAEFFWFSQQFTLPLQSMKKIVSYIYSTLFICAVLFLSACELETSGNGDLDGLWQLSLQDSVGTTVVQDMRQSGVYWAVQVRLLEIKGGPQSGCYRFKRADGRLKLYSAELDKEGHEATTPLYDYRVMKLNGSSMVLEDEKVKLTFRKY